MSFSINTLMSMTKKDLVSIIENLSREKDELFDKAERLQEEIDDMETYEDEAAQLDELKDIINNYKIAKERAYLGVSYAREEESQLLEKILDYAD